VTVFMTNTATEKIASATERFMVILLSPDWRWVSVPSGGTAELASFLRPIPLLVNPAPCSHRSLPDIEVID